MQPTQETTTLAARDGPAPGSNATAHCYAYPPLLERAGALRYGRYKRVYGYVSSIKAFRVQLTLQNVRTIRLVFRVLSCRLAHISCEETAYNIVKERSGIPVCCLAHLTGSACTPRNESFRQRLRINNKQGRLLHGPSFAQEREAALHVVAQWQLGGGTALDVPRQDGHSELPAGASWSLLHTLPVCTPPCRGSVTAGGTLSTLKQVSHMNSSSTCPSPCIALRGVDTTHCLSQAGNII